MSDQAAKNTDREIWRGKSRAEFGDDDRFYADSMFVPAGDVEALGINCGGTVIVKPVREWHRLALSPPDRASEGLRETLEHIAKAGARQNRLLERLGYVFERFPRNLKEEPPTPEDRWEYLAFHIHTDIWQLAYRAEAALNDKEAEPPAGERWMGEREALQDFVDWCDRNDWGTVPKALQAKWRAALALPSAAQESKGGQR